MTTQFVGMKDFRQNMSKYTEQANKKNIRYIVLKKNTPVLEINPIDEQNYTYAKVTQGNQTLKDMLKNVTKDQLHPETDWGEPVGKEIW